jgi:hypothetical protein
VRLLRVARLFGIVRLRLAWLFGLRRVARLPRPIVSRVLWRLMMHCLVLLLLGGLFLLSDMGRTLGLWLDKMLVHPIFAYLDRILGHLWLRAIDQDRAVNVITALYRKGMNAGAERSVVERQASRRDGDQNRQ